MQFANKKGTPFPIDLNASVKETFVGNSNSFGSDCIARASETEIRLGFYG